MRKPLTSIIIVNWNTRDLTLRCIHSVLIHTREPHELILVDNGSTDGSAEALRALESESMHFIGLPTNRGFAGGVNAGLERAEGARVCLLNSDTRVTKNWLSHLHTKMSATDSGLVGPCTDHAKGPQRRKPWLGEIPPLFRRSREVDYLSFFCVLIDRRVFDELGPLDERFGLGTFEDDDFCLRAKTRGYRLFIAARSWVWHDAHATFRANQLDDRALQSENAKLFAEKHSKPEDR